MTKKKLTAVILLGSFIMFICATFINYFSALEDMLENVRQYYKSTYSDEMIVDYIEGRIENIENLHRNILGYDPVTTLTKPAYAFALVDKNKNVLFRSENGLWWTEKDGSINDFKYASIEKFMTAEVKAEIMRIKRASGHGNVLVKLINFNTSTGKDIPVSFVLSDQKGGYSTVKLNDYTVDKTVTDDLETIISWRFYDLDENSIDHKYYQKAMTKLEKAISEYEYNENDGGHGFFSSGEYNHCSVIDGYAFFMYVEYSPFHKTITSEFFWALTFYTAIIFAFATIIILIVALYLFSKSQRIKDNQRAFISAAAHELKTPLAVIQNQCECVLDGIAPEKNEEYVESVYEEALRMSEIVKTLLLFNRISNIEEVAKSDFNLSETVENEIKKYELFAESNSAKIETDIDSDVFVNGNAELISLAVDNYLSNAIKYTDGNKKVSVSLKKDRHNFIFKVCNDCNRITFSDEVWETFTKADESRHSNGSSSGMGLPICKKIFNLHSFKYGYNKVKDGVEFYFANKSEPKKIREFIIKHII